MAVRTSSPWASEAKNRQRVLRSYFRDTPEYTGDGLIGTTLTLDDPGARNLCRNKFGHRGSIAGKPNGRVERLADRSRQDLSVMQADPKP